VVGRNPGRKPGIRVHRVNEQALAEAYANLVRLAQALARDGLNRLRSSLHLKVEAYSVLCARVKGAPGGSVGLTST
jgi:hypothetical protein